MDPEKTLSALEAEIATIEGELAGLDFLQKRLGTLRSVRESLKERIEDWKTSDKALNSVLNRSIELLGQDTEKPATPQTIAKKAPRQSKVATSSAPIRRRRRSSKAIRWSVNSLPFSILRKALCDTVIPMDLESILVSLRGAEWQNDKIWGPINGRFGEISLGDDLPRPKSILRGQLREAAKKLLLIRTLSVPDGVTYNDTITRLAKLAENHTADKLRKAFKAWGLEVEK